MDNPILITLLSIAFIAVCLFMMLVILIQKPKGGGLSGAFGGAGGGSAQAAFGAKTGDVLTWFTVICFTLFVLTAMGLVWLGHPPIEESQDGLDPILGTRPTMTVEEEPTADDLTPDADSSVPADQTHETPATDVDSSDAEATITGSATDDNAEPADQLDTERTPEPMVPALPDPDINDR